MSVLSNRTVTRKEPRDAKPTVSQADAIPPELLVRRDNTVRYEKDGPIYATDGKVGTLRKVVVDESSAEVSEIIIAVDGSDRCLVLPADVVDRSAGAALFISLNSAQFIERVSNGPPYSKGHFARADLKALLRAQRRLAADDGPPDCHQRRGRFCGDAAGFPTGSPAPGRAGFVRGS